MTLAVTAQSESPTTQTNSATSPDEAAVPLVSENAAAEVPHAEVASQDDLAAAQEKSQAGPSNVPTDISSSGRQAPQVSRGTGGRARQQKRPRTVEVTQLQPGAEFEGTIVRDPRLVFPTHYALSSVALAVGTAAHNFIAADVHYVRRYLSWHMAHLWTLELSPMAWFMCHRCR